MARQAVTPGALYKLLNDAFRQQRQYQCQCRMPLPYLVERPDSVSANWRIGTATPCPNGCDRIIAEISAKLWPSFDLHDPTAQPVKPRPVPQPDSTKTDS